MLQARVRGYQARKEWKRKRDAVILLQAHARGGLARKAMKKRKTDVSSTERTASNSFWMTIIKEGKVLTGSIWCNMWFCTSSSLSEEPKYIVRVTTRDVPNV